MKGDQTWHLASNLTPKGWVFTGTDTDDLGQVFYLYQTGDYITGFKVMLLLKEDLTAENIAVMLRESVTRIFNFDYSIFK